MLTARIYDLVAYAVLVPEPERLIGTGGQSEAAGQSLYTSERRPRVNGGFVMWHSDVLVCRPAA